MNCNQPVFTHLSPQPIRPSDSHLLHRPHMHTDRRTMHTLNPHHGTTWYVRCKVYLTSDYSRVEWKVNQCRIKGEGCGMKRPCLSQRYYPIMYTIIVATHTHKYTKISFIHTMNLYVFRSAIWPSTGILNTKVKYIKGTKQKYKYIRTNVI